MRVATVTTLRCSPGVTANFIRYHRAIGIDRLYLFFDDPEPGMVFDAADPAVAATPCPWAHYQPLQEAMADKIPTLPDRQFFNAGRALAQARDEGIDFLFHIDSDELIHAPDGDVGSIFRGLPGSVDVVVLTTLEAIPDDFECAMPFIELTRFRDQFRRSQLGIRGVDFALNGLVARWERLLVRAAGAGAALFQDEYFRGHTKGKSAVRVSAEIGQIGNHRPQGKGGSRLSTRLDPRARILHYDSTTFSDWRSKWMRRLQTAGRSERMRRNRITQGHLFAELQQASDEDALKRLYKDLYMMEPAVFGRLQRIGLTRRVTEVSDILQKASAAVLQINGPEEGSS